MSIKAIDEAKFDKIVSETQKPVLVDFYADWCGPCRMLSPVIHELAQENPDTEFYKVNIDENIELAQRFGVMSIPTIVVIKNGVVVSKQAGVMPKSSYEMVLKSV